MKCMTQKTDTNKIEFQRNFLANKQNCRVEVNPRRGNLYVILFIFFHKTILSYI